MCDLKKICKDCKIEKCFCEYHTHSSRTDGKRVNCKSCRSTAKEPAPTFVKVINTDEFDWRNYPRTVKFMELLYKKQPKFKDIKLVPLEDGYQTWGKTRFIAEYGEIGIGRGALLAGIEPSFTHAVNKKEYFLNKLKDVNFEVYSKILDVDTIENVVNKTRFKTIYGDIEVIPYFLYKVKSIAIQMAIDREHFWLQRIQYIRRDYKDIDYSEFKYTASKLKAIFKCKIHNHKYRQRIDKHDLHVQGCPFCVTKIKRYTEENFKNHPEFFKGRKGILYILRLTDQYEDFYKIGITNTKKEYRFSSYKKIYNIELVHKEFDDIEKCHEAEQTILSWFADYKYIPKKYFGGYTECLSINPYEISMHYQYEKLENDRRNFCEENGINYKAENEYIF